MIGKGREGGGGLLLGEEVVDGKVGFAGGVESGY